MKHINDRFHPASKATWSPSCQYNIALGLPIKSLSWNMLCIQCGHLLNVFSPSRWCHFSWHLLMYTNLFWFVTYYEHLKVGMYNGLKITCCVLFQQQISEEMHGDVVYFDEHMASPQRSTPWEDKWAGVITYVGLWFYHLHTIMDFI